MNNGFVYCTWTMTGIGVGDRVKNNGAPACRFRVITRLVFSQLVIKCNVRKNGGSIPRIAPFRELAPIREICADPRS